jgi:hypothetical protein
MSALRRTADSQASLQEQFDTHKCEPEGSSQPARVNADVFLRQEPAEEEDEEEDDRKDNDNDDDEGTDDGYSE